MCIGGILSELLNNNNELLSQVFDSLKTKVSEINFNNWFKLSHWELESNNRVRIKVPSKFVRDWIIDNYLEIIKFEFFKLKGQEHEIILQVSQVSQINPQTSPAQTEQSFSLPSQAFSLKPTTQKPKLPVYSRYSFDNFVVGNSNQFVNAACHAVATNPAKNYNPLFIYGGVGLGKTHLLNAISLKVLEQFPHMKVVFVTGEQFTNEVINSIRYDKTYDLRKKYRVQCDVLLIDDVQFIAGKERTMEEFFHTFNTLYEARKQIVMTSDTLPKDISQLEERLRSRFGWGLLADIQAPEFETRCAILRKKAESEQIELPDDVCHFIASHITTNVRDLEGCLIRVSAFASVSGIPITIDLAKEILSQVINGFKPQMTIESIQKVVAEEFKLSLFDLKSKRRHRNLAFPRQIAMYLCKKHVHASFPEIGRQFGGKDHTTVIHAVQKIKNQSNSDSTLQSRLHHLEKVIAQPV